MTEILIRPARMDDAPALSEAGARTFVETFMDGFGIPYPEDDLAIFMDQVFSLEATRVRLADPAMGWWVGEQDGRLLGFANTGPNALPHPDARPGETELKRLYILKEAQGLGLGTRLLKVAMDWMTEHGTGAQWIGVWSGNLKAQKLYAAYGFKKAGDYQFAVGSWMDDEFILRKPA